MDGRTDRPSYRDAMTRLKRTKARYTATQVACLTSHRLFNSLAKNRFLAIETMQNLT